MNKGDSMDECLPNFFKVYLPDDSGDDLEIPISFNIFLPYSLPRHVSVRSICGNIWKLKLMKCCGEVEKFVMVDGWKRIVKDEDLKGGEFLTFEFNGHRLFNVCVYGNTTCKMLGNSMKIKEIGDESDSKDSSVDIIVIDDDDDVSGNSGDDDQDSDDDFDYDDQDSGDEDESSEDIIVLDDDSDDGDEDVSSEDIIDLDDDSDEDDSGDQNYSKKDRSNEDIIVIDDDSDEDVSGDQNYSKKDRSNEDTIVIDDDDDDDERRIGVKKERKGRGSFQVSKKSESKDK